jgi:hypothetical protein
MNLQMKRLRRILPAVMLALTGAGYSGPATVGPAVLEFVSRTPGGKRRRILGTSHKVELSLSVKVLNSVLYMSPSDESGFNLCPWAGACAGLCLGTESGRMVYNVCRVSRITKAIWLKYFEAHFLAQLDRELTNLERRAHRAGLEPLARLNGSTDILWERLRLEDGRTLFEAHPSLQFVDYTKAPQRARPDLPPNYHVLFSLSESVGAHLDAVKWLRAGGNAAIVVGDDARGGKGACKREARRILDGGTLFGFPTLNGDAHDARHRDPGGHWVVLHAKGRKAQEDESGFTVRPSMHPAIDELIQLGGTA